MSDWGVFGWERDNWECCGELEMEDGGLVGTTTFGGRVVLRVPLGGPGEGVDSELRIPI